MTLPLTSCNEPCRQQKSQRQWVLETCIDLYGLKVGMRTNRADVLDQMLLRLPTGWKLATSTHLDRLYSFWTNDDTEAVTMYRGPRRVVQNASREEALARLEFEVELFVVENNPARVFVHAGVVGWHGRAIVIPGRSYSGKSTLVAALCSAGATYFSDEYALFDADGRIHPYPRPLRLRTRSKSAVAAAVGSNDELRTAPADCQLPPPIAAADFLTQLAPGGPLPLSLVVLTHYQPGAILEPRTVSAGEALLGLLANTMSARRRPQMVLPSLQRALSHGQIVAGPRGEAEQATEQLLRLARL
jgi:hypothetical protein